MFPTGRKSWVFMYRFNGKARRITFGQYPKMSVAEFKNGNNSRAIAQIGQAIELAKQGENFPDRELAEKLMVNIVDKMQGR